MRYFTFYWKNKTYKENKQYEGFINFWHTGDRFIKRGIEKNDFVYSLTVIKGRLYPISCLQVDEIISYDELERRLGPKLAQYWVSSRYLWAKKATALNFHRVVPAEKVKELSFNSQSGITSLKFKDKGASLLDQQTLRSVRELTEKSAKILDDVLPPLQTVEDYHIEQWKRAL